MEIRVEEEGRKAKDEAEFLEGDLKGEAMADEDARIVREHEAEVAAIRKSKEEKEPDISPQPENVLS